MSDEEPWEIDPVKQMIKTRSQRNLMSGAIEGFPSQPRRSSRSQSLRGSTDKSEYDKTDFPSQPRRSSRSQSLRGSTEKTEYYVVTDSPSQPRRSSRSQSLRGSTEKNEYDKTDSSVSYRSDTTMQSHMSRGTMEVHQEDLVDESESNTNDQTNLAVSPSWICYRLILAGLLTVCVCVLGFIITCKSFYYVYRDEDFYYGLRGVTDQTTGRCVGWKIQDWVPWRDDWAKGRMPNLFIIGIVGVALVLVASIAFVVYGIVLKSRRSNQRNGSLWMAIFLGVCLIGAGVFLGVSIIGNCSNIPPLGPGGLGCNLQAWSGLALASSIGLCFMGGFLACCLPRCCDCCGLSQFLQKELIE